MTDWSKVIFRALLAALAVAAIAGCTVLSPVNIETRKAMISKLPDDLPRHASRAATLLVLPPETESIYDTTQMAYTLQPYQIAYFSQNEWGATPSQMLLPLLVRTLENTHSFAAVLTPPYSGPYAYVLRTEILELAQDFSAEPAVLHFALRLQLNDGATSRAIASKEISLRVPMSQKTPAAGIEAANNAAATALREAAGFVLEKTK